MTTETKPKLSLREKAEVLKEHGVKVTGCIEKGWVDVDKTVWQSDPIICFDGDENEGERVVKVAHECGIPVFEIRCRMFYFRNMTHCRHAHWELVP